MFLRKAFHPRHDENLMQNEGDVVAARDRFFNEKPSNVHFLLDRRFTWMNTYLEGKEAVVELGAGAGFLKEFIRNPNLKMTDIVENPWIDEKVDALNLPYEENSLDAVVCSHMLHHLAQPVPFIREIEKRLKPGGVLVIADIHTSFMFRLILRIVKHEGWNYDVDVFDEDAIVNDPNDPWSANSCIPELLFSDQAKFEHAFPNFEVLKNELFESFIFPLSGGVVSRSFTVNLPFFLLRGIEILDNCLIALFPNMFAMGRKVVLRKR
jgi:SAM-dependent methyltransferase